MNYEKASCPKVACWRCISENIWHALLGFYIQDLGNTRVLGFVYIYIYYIMVFITLPRFSISINGTLAIFSHWNGAASRWLHVSAFAHYGDESFVKIIGTPGWSRTSTSSSGALSCITHVMAHFKGWCGLDMNPDKWDFLGGDDEIKTIIL